MAEKPKSLLEGGSTNALGNALGNAPALVGTVATATVASTVSAARRTAMSLADRRTAQGARCRIISGDCNCQAAYTPWDRGTAAGLWPAVAAGGLD